MKRDDSIKIIAFFLFIMQLTTSPISEAKSQSAATLQLAVGSTPEERPPSPSGAQARDFLERARNAHNSQDSTSELAELQAGIASLGQTSQGLEIWTRLATYWADRGNYVKSVLVREDQIKVAEGLGLFGLSHALYGFVAAIKAQQLQDKAGSIQAFSRMQALAVRLRRGPTWNQHKNSYETQTAFAAGKLSLSFGKFEEAQTSFQACLEAVVRHLSANPNLRGGFEIFLPECSRGLIDALIGQGKLAEAGIVAAKTLPLLEKYADQYSRPSYLPWAMISFAVLAMEQGHSQEATEILLRIHGQLLAINNDESSGHLARVRALMARMAMFRADWEEAERIHLSNSKSSVGAATADWAYTLIRLGKKAEAITMMKVVLARSEKVYDDGTLNLWEDRAFYGVALAANGQSQEAFSTLQKSVPRLIEFGRAERTGPDAGVVRAKRLNWILECYLDLLANPPGAGSASSMEVINEALKIADIARRSAVQYSLSAAVSRAKLPNPELERLARQEQDLQREISALSDALGNSIARGRVAENDKIVADMRATLVGLRRQHLEVSQILSMKFPAYADLLRPREVAVDSLQALLEDEEAMISFFVGEVNTFVWTIPKVGKAQFASISIGMEELNATVRLIRDSMEAESKLVAFDFEAAYGLYQSLLAPFESNWKSARRLILVPHGPLSAIPFSVLTTRPFRANSTEVPFADYARAPWLLKSFSISQLPSVSALTLLRPWSTKTSATRPFVGFGDPVFSMERPVPSSTEVRAFSRRPLNSSMRQSKKSSVASEFDLSAFAALPDTSQEVTDIATLLRANHSRDLFLQKRATETNVKTFDLSQYQVVMFATHGLAFGDVPGLYQPALVFSNPSHGNENEDGLLTLDEVMGLKLRADWVVLSACNTASSDGRSDEAVSGLGQAFFFAGARSLLLTSWAVETVSARLLTTEIFRRKSLNPKMSRAQALQESSLALMDQGTSAHSYAHPMFWAPYIIVGDGAL
jgi:CHAT domain-containing protein